MNKCCYHLPLKAENKAINQNIFKLVIQRTTVEADRLSFQRRISLTALILSSSQYTVFYMNIHVGH